MELFELLSNDSNVLITRQLQKGNYEVNLGEHKIVFLLEMNARLAHDPISHNSQQKESKR